MSMPRPGPAWARPRRWWWRWWRRSAPCWNCRSARTTSPTSPSRSSASTCGLAGGKQDQYAAAFGGANFIEFLANDRVIVNPLRVPRAFVNELETSLVTCFTGVSRRSDMIIAEQQRRMVSPTAELAGRPAPAQERRHRNETGAAARRDPPRGGNPQPLLAGQEENRRRDQHRADRASAWRSRWRTAPWREKCPAPAAAGS